MKKITLASLAVATSMFAASAFAGTPAPLPEPGTLGLLAAGLAGVVAVRLMKRK